MKTWSAGEKLLAADLNANFVEVGGADVVLPTANDASSVTITAGKPVAIATANVDADIAAAISQATQNASVSCYLTNWAAQTFTTTARALKIISATVFISMQINENESWVVDLCTVTGGVPGTVLATKTQSINAFGGGAFTFVFTTPYTCSPSTQYCIRVQCTVNAFNYIYYKNTDVYAGGQFMYSANSGSSWTQVSTGDMYFQITETQHSITAGYIYPARADITQLATGFVGFAQQTIAVNSSGRVRTGGIDANQSGLTALTDYYISNTPGTIQTTAGTTVKKVGRAIAATQISTNIYL
jgi:hypothetical protein